MLAHPQEAEQMRKAALAAVDAGHRAQHRAQAFTRKAFELLSCRSQIVASRQAEAEALRKGCLRLLYLHWAEEMVDNALREAYLAAARGDFERMGSF